MRQAALKQMQRRTGLHAALSLKPIRGRLLPRKCAFGTHTMAGGEYEECTKKRRLGLQTKLKVNEPGDIYEQEADRIADQVMATQAHRAASGTPPRIQRYSGQPTGQIDAAPASVDAALASPDSPLEPALRQDMEQCFGCDFSLVRVHSGGAAEQSAREVNARAYTIGHHIVFGAGRFAPGTQEGRQLIAHELAHVVQQSTSYSVPRIVQRSPDKKADFDIGVPENLLLWSTAVWPKRLSYEQEILTLAANPDHADSRWKGLTPQARIGVAVNMARFYGASFAKQFVQLHEAGKLAKTMFEQVGADTTPAQLTVRGYHLAGTQAQMDVEIWFHPSGNRLHRVIPSQPAKKIPSKSPEAQLRPKQPPEQRENPLHIDPLADPETTYGPKIATRDSAEGLLRGHAILYGDGTILLYSPGSSRPETFRPVVSGTGYEFYDKNGDKTENVVFGLDVGGIFVAGGGGRP
jgi:hypothetical protein